MVPRTKSSSNTCMPRPLQAPTRWFLDNPMFEADANFYDAPLDINDLRDSRSLAVQIIGENKRVLELGAATGRVTQALKANGCEVVAFERDVNAAQRLRELCPVI